MCVFVCACGHHIHYTIAAGIDGILFSLTFANSRITSLRSPVVVAYRTHASNVFFITSNPNLTFEQCI